MSLSEAANKTNKRWSDRNGFGISSETLSNMNKELSELRNDFKKIESEFSVIKNVNSKLHERVVA